MRPWVKYRTTRAHLARFDSIRSVWAVDFECRHTPVIWQCHIRLAVRHIAPRLNEQAQIGIA